MNVRTLFTTAVVFLVSVSFCLAEDPESFSYGPHDAQSGDLYRLGGDAANRPALIYVHGGGWYRGDKSRVGHKAGYCADHGIVFISINYRLLPEGRHPANADDVARAVAHVIAQAENWGIDPQRVFLMGHSAGAHLVSLVGTNPQHLEASGHKPTDLAGVIAVDTMAYDLVDFLSRPSTPELHHRVFGDEREGHISASPQWHVKADRDYPPFLIAYSSGAKTPNPLRGVVAKTFAETLRKAGGKATVVDASHTDHAGINLEIGREASLMTKVLTTFLSDQP